MPPTKGGGMETLMEIFNIIVGIFTIIGAIASVISLFILHNIEIQQKISGSHNLNQTQVNRGKNNQNTIFDK